MRFLIRGLQKKISRLIFSLLICFSCIFRASFALFSYCLQIELQLSLKNYSDSLFFFRSILSLKSRDFVLNHYASVHYVEIGKYL